MRLHSLLHPFTSLLLLFFSLLRCAWVYLILTKIHSIHHLIFLFVHSLSSFCQHSLYVQKLFLFICLFICLVYLCSVWVRVSVFFLFHLKLRLSFQLHLCNFLIKWRFNVTFSDEHVNSSDNDIRIINETFMIREIVLCAGFSFYMLALLLNV